MEPAGLVLSAQLRRGPQPLSTAPKCLVWRTRPRQELESCSLEEEGEPQQASVQQVGRWVGQPRATKR